LLLLWCKNNEQACNFFLIVLLNVWQVTICGKKQAQFT
jgi:hypothetical protein